MTTSFKTASRFDFTAAGGAMTLYGALIALSVVAEMFV